MPLWYALLPKLLILGFPATAPEILGPLGLWRRLSAVCVALLPKLPEAATCVSMIPAACRTEAHALVPTWLGTVSRHAGASSRCDQLAALLGLQPLSLLLLTLLLRGACCASEGYHG